MPRTKITSERARELGKLAASKVDRDPVTHKFRRRAAAEPAPEPAVTPAEPPATEPDDAPDFAAGRRLFRRLRRPSR